MLIVITKQKVALVPPDEAFIESLITSFSFIFLAPLLQTIGKTATECRVEAKDAKSSDFALSRQLNFACFLLRNIQMDVKLL